LPLRVNGRSTIRKDVNECYSVNGPMMPVLFICAFDVSEGRKDKIEEGISIDEGDVCDSGTVRC